MANDDTLVESIQMIKAGRKAEAQLVLEPYIQANPHNIQAWMWEAELFPVDADKIRVLEICLEHNPDHPQVKHGLEILRTRCGIHAPLVETTAPISPIFPNTSDPMTAPDPLIPAEQSIVSPAAPRSVERTTGQVPQREQVKTKKHPDWLSNTGIVDTSEVLRVRSQLPMYRAGIAAIYMVSGKEYHVQHSAARKNRLASMDAEILTSNYPRGSSVTVRYDPKHPNRARVDDWEPAETRQKLKQFKDRPEIRKILSGRHRKRMLTGLTWGAGGIVATIISVAVLPKFIGYYVVFGGAIIYGLFTFFSGLVGWLWYWD